MLKDRPYCAVSAIVPLTPLLLVLRAYSSRTIPRLSELETGDGKVRDGGVGEWGMGGWCGWGMEVQNEGLGVEDCFEQDNTNNTAVVRAGDQRGATGKASNHNPLERCRLTFLVSIKCVTVVAVIVHKHFCCQETKGEAEERRRRRRR